MARVVVHFDGACEPARGGGVAAYGFTVEGEGQDREASGLAVPRNDPSATNNVAEYVGAIRALEFLARSGYSGPVEIRGDSQLVIRQSTGEYAVRTAHLKPLHDRLMELTKSFEEVRFRWVPREENQRADALSKQGLLGRPAAARSRGR
ncbi:MAG: ribonuclease HI [Thermoplasmata archaeon]